MSTTGNSSAVRRGTLERLADLSRRTAILAVFALIVVIGYAFANPSLARSGSTAHEPAYGLVKQPDGRPRHPHVGLVAGHWGNDSGAVCPDGLTEQSLNLGTARQVKTLLETQGYRVDLLQEFDPRLEGYVADALVSIHTDSCDYINEFATGFKVARSAASFEPDTEDRLVGCLKEKYAEATGLGFHENSITSDMTSYHTFSEVAPDTPAAIIEIGFLYLDRPVLVGETDRVASGIAEGIACFVRR